MAAAAAAVLADRSRVVFNDRSSGSGGNTTSDGTFSQKASALPRKPHAMLSQTAFLLHVGCECIARCSCAKMSRGCLCGEHGRTALLRF